jgi:hypothetical protein
MSGLQRPSIMEAHDPNDDPFGDLAPPDDSGLVSPMDFGSGAVEEATKEDVPAPAPPVAKTAPAVAESTSVNDEKKEDDTKAE